MKKTSIITSAMLLLLPFASQTRAHFNYSVEGKISLSRNVIAGSAAVTGTVHLSRPAPFDIEIAFKSDNPAVARPDPEKITVRAGQTASSRFRIITRRVDRSAKIRIAAYSLKATISDIYLLVTVQPESINVVPSVIQGGHNAVGSLVLSGAPPSGAQATITSSNPQILRFGSGPISTAPANISINLSGLTNQFQVTTGTVSENTTVTISATYNGVTVTKNVAVTKPFGQP